MENKPAAPKKYKLLISIAKVLGSGLLLVWATFGLDWAKFGQVLTEINLWYLLLTPLAYALNNTFSALRWQVILKQWDIDPGAWKLWKIYLISSFWGNFLPSTIGGDGYRFLALQSLPNTDRTKIFSSLFLDRLYGFAALGVMHFIVAIFFWSELRKSTFLAGVELSIFAAAIVFGLIWLFAGRFFNSRNSQISSTGWLARVINKISEIFTLFKELDWHTIALGLFYSALFVGTVAFAWQINYLAAGVQVNWGVAFYAATLIGILGILPITLNGIGIMELCQVTILNWQGLPIEKAILAAFLTRIMLVLLTLPGGLLYLFDSFKLPRTSVD